MDNVPPVPAGDPPNQALGPLSDPPSAANNKLTELAGQPPMWILLGELVALLKDSITVDSWSQYVRLIGVLVILSAVGLAFVALRTG